MFKPKFNFTEIIKITERRLHYNVYNIRLLFSAINPSEVM